MRSVPNLKPGHRKWKQGAANDCIISQVIRLVSKGDSESRVCPGHSEQQQRFKQQTTTSAMQDQRKCKKDQSKLVQRASTMSDTKMVMLTTFSALKR